MKQVDQGRKALALRIRSFLGTASAGCFCLGLMALFGGGVSGLYDVTVNPVVDGQPLLTQAGSNSTIAIAAFAIVFGILTLFGWLAIPGSNSRSNTDHTERKEDRQL